MANKSRGTWYVSFELPRGKRVLARATETFPNEREAKKFARAKLAAVQNVSSGTLNPYLPKQTIAAAHMLEWLDEPDEDDLRDVLGQIGIGQTSFGHRIHQASITAQQFRKRIFRPFVPEFP